MYICTGIFAMAKLYITKHNFVNFGKSVCVVYLYVCKIKTLHVSSDLYNVRFSYMVCTFTEPSTFR